MDTQPQDPQPTTPPSAQAPAPAPAPAPGTAQADRAGCLRLFMYGALATLFLVLAGAAFVVVVGLRTVDRGIVEPVSALVRELALEATPEILPSAVTIVREINKLARLETASYQMEKIVSAERDTDRLFGILGEKLIFVAVGEVIAGVDFARMAPEDIVVYDAETVAVHLPEAEVFVATLDNDLSYVYDRDRGLLAAVDPQLETQVRQTAEREILDAALERGIIDDATANAEEYMRSLLGALGFTTIEFTSETPVPAPPRDTTPPKGFTTP